MELKTLEIDRKIRQKEDAWECPVAGAGAPGSEAPRILFLTAFTIDFFRFEVHFSCSAWVLRRDSISALVWYGLRSNFLVKGRPAQDEETLRIFSLFFLGR